MDFPNGGAALPPLIEGWFRQRGWTAHPHQRAVVEASRAKRSVLLVAPTGGGKTLAGFLPSLADLAARPITGLHTLYISPLKALAVDIHRNLEIPIAEMRLPIRHETRTGDTPSARRERQRRHPPQMLMTTPESLALMLSYPDAQRIFGTLRAVIIDELHALAGTRRGDLLALGLSRLSSLAPMARRVGLSATVADPDAMRAYLSADGRSDDANVVTIRGRSGAAPEIAILSVGERLPWAGHMGLHAMEEVLARVSAVRTALIFVNTRAQAELVFQELWRLNRENLPIALHHGSLSVEQRRRVEAAMAAGKLRAVVATSSLDLGVDWAAVDLVIQIGAPKGVSRLLQRIGRANHRLDEPSRALLVPSNRFEFLECQAALEGIEEGDLDGDPILPGALDVLAQHLLGMACARPFRAEDVYAEVARAAPYAALTRTEFDEVLAFAATGGYALAGYERFHKLIQDPDGRWKPSGRDVPRRYRMNVGTIVEAPLLKVRMRKGPWLGQIEEYFVSLLTPGDTFLFAGRLLRFEGIRENVVEASPGGQGDPMIPAYAGGRLPLTTHLADRVRRLLAEPVRWGSLDPAVTKWLRMQSDRSLLPDREGLLVETFPRGGKHFLVAYVFEGRNAHQTLGMLLTRRMERAGLGPLGFAASDYVLTVWSLRPAADLEELFSEDMLGDDLEAWMAESSLLRRTFRTVTIVAGLVERRHPGAEKTGRQVTVSADLIYDVLRRHEPGHILLRAARQEAGRGLTDVTRLAAMLKRVAGRIVHRALDRVSPLAAPALLEIGREQVGGDALETLLAEEAAKLMAEAAPSASAA